MQKFRNIITVTKTTPSASLLQPSGPVLGIKVDNVSCTAEQSQESMFSLFLPLTGVVWGKKKDPKNQKKKRCLQVCFVASHVEVVKGDTSSEEQTQHLLNAPFSSLLGLPVCFSLLFCPVLFYSLFVASVACRINGLPFLQQCQVHSRASLAPPLPGDESGGGRTNPFPCSACVTENELPRQPANKAFFFFFLLHFPFAFKQNTAPRGGPMTAIKGNLRVRGWCCFSPGQSIFAL